MNLQNGDRIFVLTLDIPSDDGDSSTEAFLILDPDIDTDRRAVEAARNAVQAYVESDEGKESYKDYGSFNWGDAFTYMESRHWETFGLKPLAYPQVLSEIVDHDEGFNPDEEDLSDKEEDLPFDPEEYAGFLYGMLKANGHDVTLPYVRESILALRQGDAPRDAAQVTIRARMLKGGLLRVQDDAAETSRDR